MRFTVSGDAVLSLPVSGGASALKNGTPSSWATSREAERDARKILHTLATLYGRTPFHALLAPLLFAPIESCFSGPRVCRTLCMEAFEAVSGVLGIGDEDFLSTFRDALLSQDHLGPVINEMRASMHARWSIIDLLMRLGPDAIFALVPSFYLNKL